MCLHVGGAWTLAEVSQALKHLLQPSGRSSIAPCAIVFDSSPGDITLVSAQGGFAGPIQNPLQRSMAMVFISTVYLYAVGYSAITGRSNPWPTALVTLNTPDFLPWTSTKSPRLYVYSVNDNISSASRIEAHIEGARAEGIRVHTLRFEDSEHVAHARRHPVYYWGAIENLWAEAVEMVSSPRLLAKL